MRIFRTIGLTGFAVALAFAALTIERAVAAEGKLVHAVTFSNYEEGSVEDWLKEKGFKFERDAKNRDKIDLEIGDKDLVFYTKRKAFGIFPNESVNVPGFAYVEVDWGVDKFPAGASYEQGVRNEALMLIIFMGDEKQPSGSWLIPDSPYFIGLFICHDDDKEGFPYVGSYFKKGGRYVCQDRPVPGQMVTTRFDLLDAYRKFFDEEKDDDPVISGIALEIDTEKSKDDGKAKAFIREVRFYR